MRRYRAVVARLRCPDYVGRYTHRVAISNHRIVDIEDGQVKFLWRDYRNNNQQKTMPLSAEEFIRRFLLHVLPSGFHRIRYYGFLGNRASAAVFPLATSHARSPSSLGEKHHVTVFLAPSPAPHE